MATLVDELDRLRAPVLADVMELMPSVPGPTSKPRRSTFAVSLLIGLVCTTIGWVGRGQLAPPQASEPTSVSAASPCALEPGEPVPRADSVLIVTCSRIRAGKLREASQLWDVEFDSRRYPSVGTPTDNEVALLRAETLIVVRTFMDQADRLHRWPRLSSVTDDSPALARRLAQRWATQVEGLEPND